MFTHKFMLILSFALCFEIVTEIQAGDVKIREAHLCCAGCRSAAEEVLEGVKGVSAIQIDINNKIITFKATDEKVSQSAIDALQDHGFHGRANHDDKIVAFPTVVKKDAKKVSKFTVGSMHLCCNSCVKASQAALENVAGIQVISIDRNEEKLTVEGKDISPHEVISALNKAGFAGKPITTEETSDKPAKVKRSKAKSSKAKSSKGK